MQKIFEAEDFRVQTEVRSGDGNYADCAQLVQFLIKSVMDLFVYKGEFKLPSIDFDCLRVLVSCSI